MCCFIDVLQGSVFMNDFRDMRKVKDPGSAITHFIGMMMAIFAGVPFYL